MSALSLARVPTAHASRYLQQLAKHWSHKMTVVFSPTQATIDFPNDSRLTMRAADSTLDLELAVAEGEDVGRLRDVVERHLNRFAFREAPLTFEWQEG